MLVTSKIITIKGSQPGPAVAIFAGVHGNETAGVFALQELLPELKITRGTLYIAFANPPAIKANVRMMEKNLNRCLYKGNTGTGYEDKRARQLMKVLDKSDALLDLHMFYDDDGEPFAICEPDAVELASTFDVNIVSTNWTDVEPGGTDGYMYVNGKIGICVECGPISKARDYKDFAIKTIYQFLQYFDMTDKTVSTSTKPKRNIKAQYAVFKESESFTLAPGFKNFQALEAGQVIATDNSQQYIAKEGECIIFPHYGARLNEEAYIIGLE